jgi:hypothetical protein
MLNIWNNDKYMVFFCILCITCCKAHPNQTGEEIDVVRAVVVSSPRVQRRSSVSKSRFKVYVRRMRGGSMKNDGFLAEKWGGYCTTYRR